MKCPMLKDITKTEAYSKERFLNCEGKACAWFTSANGCAVKVLSELKLNEYYKSENRLS